MALIQRIPLGAQAAGFALNYDNIIKVFVFWSVPRGGWAAGSRAKVSARVVPKWPAFISCWWPQQLTRGRRAEGFSKRFSVSKASPFYFPLTCRATRTHAECRPNNAPLARACLIVDLVIIYEPESSDQRSLISARSNSERFRHGATVRLIAETGYYFYRRRCCFCCCCYVLIRRVRFDNIIQ